jgi:hypothetical protein
MANAKKSTEITKVENEAIVSTESTIPSYITKGDTRGTEHITKDDARIPRLVLAQAMSPQLSEAESNYIDGLKFGDAFNDLTGENYGKDPLPVVVVRADKPRYVEFAPREMGGGIVDGNVPSTDPRTQFTTDEKGQRQKPIATKFYDYVVLVGPDLQPMAMSLKGSGLFAAKTLNGLMRMKPVPIFACRYTLTPVAQSAEIGKWYTWAVKQAGFVDEATYLAAEKAFEAWREKEVSYETAPAHEAEVVGPDAEGAEAEM